MTLQCGLTVMSENKFRVRQKTGEKEIGRRNHGMGHTVEKKQYTLTVKWPGFQSISYTLMITGKLLNVSELACILSFLL